MALRWARRASPPPLIQKKSTTPGAGRVPSEASARRSQIAGGLSAAQAGAGHAACRVRRFNIVPAEAKLLEEVEVHFNVVHVKLRAHDGEVDRFDLLNHGH